MQRDNFIWLFEYIDEFYFFNFLIQVASSALGFGPQMAMQVAERLYTQGFIR